MPLYQTAALSFSIIVACAGLFQLALAAGFPWGEYAMGGKYPGKMPGPIRAGAAVQAFVLSLLGTVVLNRAGLLELNQTLNPILIWVVVAFSAVSLMMNTITPSLKERKVWMPASFLMLATSLIVAISA